MLYKHVIIMMYAYFSSPSVQGLIIAFISTFSVSLWLQVKRPCLVCGSLSLSYRGHLHTQHDTFKLLKDNYLQSSTFVLFNPQPYFA